MVISFKGLPPHDLGFAETGSAHAVNGLVEVTMNTLDAWHSPPGQLLRFQMKPAVARAFAERLSAAAAEAEPDETK
jgi:hypothetical protein